MFHHPHKSLSIIYLCIISLLSLATPANANELSSQSQKDIEDILNFGQKKQDTKALEQWLRERKQNSIIVDVDKSKINGPIATDKGINIDALLHKYNTSKFEQGNSANYFPNLIVFASLGLPKNTLIKLLKDTYKAGGKVIIRGMIDGNNIRKTAEALQTIVQKSGVGNVDIDPRPFRTFKITKVPAFVITKVSYSQCKDTDCKVNTPIFDKLVGNVSLQYALESIAHDGETKAIAQKHLDKLEVVE